MNEVNKTIPVHEISSVHYQLATDFYIQVLKGEQIVPEEIIIGWADAFRKMTETDMRTEGQIREVMKYIQEDSFYRELITTPTKIRMFFDQVTIGMVNNKLP